MSAKGDVLSACSPDDVTDMRSVVPVARSLTKTSRRALVSSGTRFEASLEKTTNLPSPLTRGRPEPPLP